MLLRAGVGNAIVATLLALAAAGAGRLLGRRPAIRHALWVLVLIKLVTPPLSVVPLAWVPAPAAPARGEDPQWTEDLALAGPLDADVLPAPPVDEIEPVEPVRAATPGVPWRTLLAGAWLAGTCAAAAVALVRIRQWRRLLALIGPAPPALQARLDELSARMGLGRRPSLWWFPGPAAPMLWALGREARVIVPLGLWEGLDERQRTTLLVHELAHLRRRDHWVRLLELVATACYWWLPPVWIARRALREAEEQCCDAWVVSVCPDDARTYAETLLQTVDFLSGSAPGLPLAASGFGHVHHLKRRLIMIMRGTTHRSLDRPGLLGVLGLAALLLPLSPTWAQKDDEPKSPDRPADVRPAETPKPGDDDPFGDANEKLSALKKLAEEDHEGAVNAKLSALKALQDATQSLKAGKGEGESPDDDDRARGKDADPGESIADKRHRRTAESLLDRKKELLKPRPDRKSSDDLVRELTDRAGEVAAQAAKERLRLQGRDSDKALAIRLAQAKAEVQRARAQLAAAEKRLAALGDTSNKSLFKPTRPQERPKLERANDPDAPKGADRAPSTSDKRIAEIEARLEQLIDEVRSLKGQRATPLGR